MFTKLFKKSHDPYELDGRWYRMRISFIDENMSILKSDIPVSQPGVFPTNMVYDASYNENIFKIHVVNGLIIDYIINPIEGNLTIENISLSEDVPTGIPVNSSKFNMPLDSSTATVDIYLYIVKR